MESALMSLDGANQKLDEIWLKKKRKEFVKAVKTFVYGRDKTIHQTKILNIEVDEKTGEVVSVWFRCLGLPFDVSKVNKSRVKEMKRMYKETDVLGITAVEVEQGES